MEGNERAIDAQTNTKHIWMERIARRPAAEALWVKLYNP
jgi:hypothetical protein